MFKDGDRVVHIPTNRHGEVVRVNGTTYYVRWDSEGDVPDSKLLGYPADVLNSE
jgi:hypothetical protein